MHTFIQISDCHIDDNKIILGVNALNNLEKIIKKISTTKHQALVISGDLTHNGSLNSYKLLKEKLDTLTTDLFIIAGNHDNIDNLNQVFTKNVATNFNLGIWKIISINSVQTAKADGYLTKKELLKLNNTLKYSKAKYHIIIMHHPPLSKKNKWKGALPHDNSNKLFATLNKYSSIKAILCGHVHRADEFNTAKLKLISCPSTATQYNEKTKIGFKRYTLFNNGNIKHHTKWLSKSSL